MPLARCANTSGWGFGRGLTNWRETPLSKSWIRPCSQNDSRLLGDGHAEKSNAVACRCSTRDSIVHLHRRPWRRPKRRIQRCSRCEHQSARGYPPTGERERQGGAGPGRKVLLRLQRGIEWPARRQAADRRSSPRIRQHVCLAQQVLQQHVHICGTVLVRLSRPHANRGRGFRRAGIRLVVGSDPFSR